MHGLPEYITLELKNSLATLIREGECSCVSRLTSLPAISYQLPFNFLNLLFVGCLGSFFGGVVGGVWGAVWGVLEAFLWCFVGI